MEINDPCVHIIDDDSSVREALAFLLKSVGLLAQTFESAKAFLEQYQPEQAGCIVSDIRMPGMSGLALQQELLERQSVHPIIFISGHGDIPMAVDAVKNGALNFLTKPFRDQDLLDCIDEAIAKNAVARQQTMRHSQLERRLNELTRRESQVLDGVVAGLSNKEIAEQLHVSPRTVEVHRGHMMEKMGARSLTELLKSMGKI